MNDHRTRIDAVDDAIVRLLAERAAIVEELWEAKRRAGVSVKDPAREDAVFARVREAASRQNLDPAAVEAVFRAIVGRPLR